jgi:beta-glucanase (GH16 family)
MKHIVAIISLAFLSLTVSCNSGLEKNDDATPLETDIWELDFLDDFNTFNPDNWQDQRIWVNNETHCYVPDNEFGTREVSEGSLKIKVINIGEKRDCDNLDKHGEKHPDTEYVAGRIASKNRKEFVKGKWTARLRLSSNGEASTRKITLQPEPSRA